jgi:hypothetical protein
MLLDLGRLGRFDQSLLSPARNRRTTLRLRSGQHRARSMSADYTDDEGWVLEVPFDPADVENGTALGGLDQAVLAGARRR